MHVSVVYGTFLALHFSDESARRLYSLYLYQCRFNFESALFSRGVLYLILALQPADIAGLPFRLARTLLTLQYSVRYLTVLTLQYLIQNTPSTPTSRHVPNPRKKSSQTTKGPTKILFLPSSLRFCDRRPTRNRWTSSYLPPPFRPPKRVRVWYAVCTSA